METAEEGEYGRHENDGCEEIKVRKTELGSRSYLSFRLKLGRISGTVLLTDPQIAMQKCRCISSFGSSSSPCSGFGA